MGWQTLLLVVTTLLSLHPPKADTCSVVKTTPRSELCCKPRFRLLSLYSSQLQVLDLTHLPCWRPAERANDGSPHPFWGEVKAADATLFFKHLGEGAARSTTWRALRCTRLALLLREPPLPCKPGAVQADPTGLTVHEAMSHAVSAASSRTCDALFFTARAPAGARLQVGQGTPQMATYKTDGEIKALTSSDKKSDARLRFISEEPRGDSNSGAAPTGGRLC